MNRFTRPILSLIALLAVLKPTNAASQFCEVNEIEQRDVCVAINTFHNASSGANDFYMTMSAKFPRGFGWVAIGSGYIMHRSLMFIMYPGKEPGSVIVGPRSTSYHDKPENSEGIPEFRVVDTSYEDGYSSASFTCYACDMWDGNRLDIDAENQPWIWAASSFQGHTSDDPNKPLTRHNFYGDFHMDMTMTQVKTAQEPFFPEITLERISISAGGYGQDEKVSTSRTFVIHGALLAMAFAILFPGGIFAIISDRWSSVRFHWMVQTATSFFCLLGVAVGLFATLKKHGLNGLLGLHQLLGCAIGLGFVYQLVLGYRHHVQYVKFQQGSAGSKPAPWMIKLHKALGRSIYVIGCANVFFGINMAGNGGILGFGWVVVVGFEIVLYLVTAYATGNRWEEGPLKETAYHAVDTADEAIPFTEVRLSDSAH